MLLNSGIIRLHYDRLYNENEVISQLHFYFENLGLPPPIPHLTSAVVVVLGGSS